jgi:hypothetical protein
MFQERFKDIINSEFNKEALFGNNTAKRISSLIKKTEDTSLKAYAKAFTSRGLGIEDALQSSLNKGLHYQKKTIKLKQMQQAFNKKRSKIIAGSAAGAGVVTGAGLGSVLSRKRSDV